MGNIGKKNCISKLLKILNGNYDNLARIGAAHALGLLKVNDGFEFCKECIEKRRWRTAAIKALKTIQHRDRIKIIISALDDPNFMVRKYVVQSLGDIGTEKEISILQKAAEHDNEIWVREDAKKSIVKIKQRIKN